MRTRKVIGVVVTAVGVTAGGITQGSDWQPDRLRFAVVLAGYVVAVVGLAIWNRPPTARELDVEAERSTWPGWRQAVLPVGAAALVTQLVLRVFGADRHHLIAAQIATATVVIVCLGIGAVSYLRRSWSRVRDGASGADSGQPGVTSQ